MLATTRALGSLIATATLLLASGGPARAALLTFEDVPGSTPDRVGNMPTYHGFNFSFTLDWIDVVDSVWPYGAHAGEFALLNNNGGVGVITEATGADFTFGGLWAKQWSRYPESGGPDALFGVLEGYNDGAQVWSVPTGLNGSYEFYGPRPGVIDELRLGFGNHFLVDDVSLDLATVPEPSCLVALALGACVLGSARRRRTALRARA